jgi:tetratricopeptide (TPR) repeat protein
MNRAWLLLALIGGLLFGGIQPLLLGQTVDFESEIAAGNEVSFPIKYNSAMPGYVYMADGTVTLSKTAVIFRGTVGASGFNVSPDKILAIVNQPEEASRLYVQVAVKNKNGDKEHKEQYYLYNAGATAIGGDEHGQGASISCDDCNDSMDVLYGLLTKFCGKKVIQDTKEYKAYIAAVKSANATQRATALESFLQTYPNTVMREEVTAVLMGTYQQLLATDPQKYTQKVLDTGQQVLQINPTNLTALALLSNMNHMLAQRGGPNAKQMLQQAGQYGELGMQQLQTQVKLVGLTDEQSNKFNQGARIIFLGSIGHAALVSKDYKTAQESLKEVVAADPDNFGNVFLLAMAYMEPTSPVPDGIFWFARAIGLAPPQLPATKLETYKRAGHDIYVSYHGSEEGWDQLLAMAKTARTIPAGYAVTPTPLKLPSTYARTQTPADRLQLNADKSFSLQEDGQTYHGTFVVNGNALELNISETNTKTTVTREGSKFTDSNGQTWILRE